MLKRVLASFVLSMLFCFAAFAADSVVVDKFTGEMLMVPLSSFDGDLTGDLSVSGTATLTGNVTAKGDLIVEGALYGDGSQLTGVTASESDPVWLAEKGDYVTQEDGALYAQQSELSDYAALAGASFTGDVETTGDVDADGVIYGSMIWTDGYIYGDGSQLKNLPEGSSSPWTEDTYGLTYADNIGIGTASVSGYPLRIRGDSLIQGYADSWHGEIFRVCRMGSSNNDTHSGAIYALTDSRVCSKMSSQGYQFYAGYYGWSDLLASIGMSGSSSPGYRCGTFSLYNLGALKIRFDANGNSYVNIGYFGVGTASPTSEFDVGGGAKTNIDGADDALIADDLEVDGVIYNDGIKVIAGNYVCYNSTSHEFYVNSSCP